MKPTGLLVAVAVLACLGLTWWWFQRHPSPNTASANAPIKLISSDPAQIQNIRIVKAGSAPVVLNKTNDVWKITEPRQLEADSEIVSPLTGTIGSLSADRLIDDKATDLAPFGLTNPPEEVDVTLKNGKTTKLLIGSDSPTGSSTYAKLEGDPKIYTISSSLKTDLGKSLNDLREKRLMTFNQNKVKSITLNAKGQSMQFDSSPDIGWHFAKPAGMRADGLKVDDLVRKLVDAKLEPADAENQKKEAEMFGAGKKIAAVSVTDDRGTQTMEVRKANDNNYYARSTAVDGFYRITGSDIGDALDKSPEDYRNMKVFDFGFNDVTKLEVNGQTYERQGDKWMANGVQMDTGSVQDVIDKLRDLGATKLTTKTAGVKAISFAVTSGDNHKVEKVVINKDANDYDAQREGEPTIYVLDPKPIDDLQKTISAIKQYQPPRNSAPNGPKKK